MRIQSILFAAILATAAQAAILTNGSGVYETSFQNLFPVMETDHGPAVALRPLGLDHDSYLTSNVWFYRVAGDTRERPFGTYTNSAGGSITMNETAAGNQASYAITETSAGNNVRFTAALVLTLSTPSNIDSALTIYNPSNTPLAISLFNYVDGDLENGQDDLGADLYQTNIIRQWDTFSTYYHSGPNASAYLAMPFGTPTDLLTDAFVNNLPNLVLPQGPGDITTTFQWNLVIGAGQSATINARFGTTPLAAADTPEPAAIALSAFGLAVIALGKRLW